jgi:hypothetical protein
MNEHHTITTITTSFISYSTALSEPSLSCVFFHQAACRF